MTSAYVRHNPNGEPDGLESVWNHTEEESEIMQAEPEDLIFIEEDSTLDDVKLEIESRHPASVVGLSKIQELSEYKYSGGLYGNRKTWQTINVYIKEMYRGCCHEEVSELAKNAGTLVCDKFVPVSPQADISPSGDGGCYWIYTEGKRHRIDHEFPLSHYGCYLRLRQNGDKEVVYNPNVIERREKASKAKESGETRKTKYVNMNEFYCLTWEMAWNNVQSYGRRNAKQHWAFALNYRSGSSSTIESILALGNRLKLLWLIYGPGYHRSLDVWQEFRKEWKVRGSVTIERFREMYGPVTDMYYMYGPCLDILNWIDKEAKGRQGKKPSLSKKQHLAPWEKSSVKSE